MESQSQALHEVLSNAPKQVWLQLLPLFGSNTTYQKLHRACNVNTSSLIGLLLEEGLFCYYGNEFRIKRHAIKRLREQIHAGVKYDRHSSARFGKRIRITLIRFNMSAPMASSNQFSTPTKVKLKAAKKEIYQEKDREKNNSSSITTRSKCSVNIDSETEHEHDAIDIICIVVIGIVVVVVIVIILEISGICGGTKKQICHSRI